MIRVLALYSQCKQLLNLTTMLVSVIDPTAARPLAYVLRTLLGLEATIELVLLLYNTANQGSEAPINPYKTKLTVTKLPSCCHQPYLGRSYSMWITGSYTAVDFSRNCRMVGLRKKDWMLLTPV